MAKLYKTLYNDERLQSATLTPWGPVTTAGAKTTYAPVMRMTCDRSADAQINWDEIAFERPEGFKQLCNYSLLVSLGD